MLSLQVCAFLDKLGELRSLQPLAASMCRKMNEMYGLDSSQNYEVGRSHSVSYGSNSLPLEPARGSCQGLPEVCCDEMLMPEAHQVPNTVSCAMGVSMHEQSV